MTESPRLFVPLNWRNALACYAHGLVLPRALLPRYHQDLLELAPRRLPLITDRISRSIADMCAPTRDDFPVALELDGCVAIQGAEIRVHGGRIAAAPSGIIPIAHVISVHVRSSRDQEELRANRYRNVDAENMPAAVSPALFGSDGVHASELGNWLRGLPAPEAFEEGNLTRRQCVAGAMMLLLASLPREARALAPATKLLESVLETSSRNVLSSLLHALSDIGWIGESDDRSICAVALRLLAEMSGPEPPVTSEVLESMREQLVNEKVSHRRLVMAYLDRILAIDRGEASFTSFRELGGLRSAKALLLFLLRPDPAAVTTWLADDINAELEVVGLALIFAGIAHRSTGLPSGLRGSNALQHLIFDWISIGAGRRDVSLPLSTAPSVRIEHHQDSIVLAVDSNSLPHWGGPRLSLLD